MDPLVRHHPPDEQPIRPAPLVTVNGQAFLQADIGGLVEPLEIEQKGRDGVPVPGLGQFVRVEPRVGDGQRGTSGELRQLDAARPEDSGEVRLPRIEVPRGVMLW